MDTDTTGVVLLLLLIVALVVAIIGTAVYGFLLAAHVSIILAIIVLLIEPLPLLLGICGLVGHPEVVKQLAAWLHLI